MRKSKVLSVICVNLIVLVLISSQFALITDASQKQRTLVSMLSQNNGDDWDPTVDLSVKVTIQRVRALISSVGAPSTQVEMKVTINDVEHVSDTYEGYEAFPNWAVEQDVPDDVEQVNIQFTCHENTNDYHLSTQATSAPSVTYSLKTGEWTGDDYRKDSNGYGHLIITNDNGEDFEIWFDITQNDYDGDGIPYWTEVNVLGTDPRVDDSNNDPDNDGIPTTWEWKWGYDPHVWDDHENLDPDNDAIQNTEEWDTSHWFSDPYRQDIFIEVDWKEGNLFLGSNEMPETSKHVLKTKFAEQNIMLLIDDGWMGGGEEIPADEFSAVNLRGLYREYFLHGMTNTERQGVFHYALLMGLNPWKINVGGFNFQHDAFVVCRGTICLFRWNQAGKTQATTSLFMHELGHNIGLFGSSFPGIDNPDTRYPWQDDYYKYENYQSCMNYRYAWDLIGYSDGTHGENDFDDWGNLDLTHFEDHHW